MSKCKPALTTPCPEDDRDQRVSGSNEPEQWANSPMVDDDVIKWKHFPHYWPFVRGIHRSPVNSPHRGQWRGALMFSLICVWINAWVNNREAGDLRRYCTHYDITVMWSSTFIQNPVLFITVPTDGLATNKCQAMRRHPADNKINISS